MTTSRRLPGTIRGKEEVLEASIFSPKGRLLATLCPYGEIKLWNLADHSQYDLKSTLNGSHEITEVIFSPNGRLLAATSLDPTIRLWDLRTRTQASLSGHSAQISQIAFSPDSRLLASASQDQTIRFWDPLVEIYRGALEKILEEEALEAWLKAMQDLSQR